MTNIHSHQKKISVSPCREKKPIKVELQIATRINPLPKKNDITHWINAALADHFKTGEVCVRLIDTEESARLNAQFRHKNHPTNIITFNYSLDRDKRKARPLLGDLAICAEIVNQEAKQNSIPSPARWAHLVIHGCLHLVGLTHENERNASIMENQEIALLHQLGFKNPYQLPEEKK